MILSPIAYSSSVNSALQNNALNSVPSAYQQNVVPSSPFEGTPIFLLPSQNKTPSGPKQQSAESAKPPPPILQDTSKHFHVFVGDLSPEIDLTTLRQTFSPFGEISDVKIIRDPQSLKPKGYGFVSFVQREDAEKAIEQMNGQTVGRKTIRTNWAMRKVVSNSGVTLDEIMNQTGVQNTTVYIGGITSSVTEAELSEIFAKYGTTVEIRLFRDQGYGFVRFETKEAAAGAIFNLNGTEIAGNTVRCSWGKEKTVKESPYSYESVLLQYAAAANYLDSINYCNALNNNQITSFTFPNRHHLIHHPGFYPESL